VLALGALGLSAGMVRAGAFPVITQPPANGAAGDYEIINGSCAVPPCEGGSFSLMASDSPVLLTDCTGTCRVTLVCRPPHFQHDILVADSGTLTDAVGAPVPILTACPYLFRRITICTAGTCKVRARVLEIRGNW